MIDATTHTRKIWRSHFDGADSTYSLLIKCTIGIFGDASNYLQFNAKC
jgi:hypothetical protein